MEFHVSKNMRDKCNFDETLFATSGNVILGNFKAVRIFAKKINDTMDKFLDSSKMIKAGQLNAMGLIDEIFHFVCYLYRKEVQSEAFNQLLATLELELSKNAVDELLLNFTQEFPSTAVYKGEISAMEYLASENGGVSNRVTTLEEMVLLLLANENPAFEPFAMLFSDGALALNENYFPAWNIIQDFFKTQPFYGPNMTDLITMLREPVEFSPHSLKGQLDYIRQHWASLLGEWLLRLLSGIDMISEEEKPGWSGHFSGPPPMKAYNYDSLMKEYERFSPDSEWMPRVVLMAKTVLVWLDQLSKKYERNISRLDQIPDEELDVLAQQGFTGLWLIGLWERSWASKRIKQICGNPEAAASAYSLHDYEIAEGLGGWNALDNLRRRLWYRGIRLASDMVPNHTGMDSKWVVEKPHLFLQSLECPFPTYSFNGENLSLDGRVTIQLEDNYYSKSDCAVVFKRIDNATGQATYIYHGNDGTGLPWNDTAQVDFLNPEAREEVIQKILHVARNFPIIRFDAAMVLAKKHIRRLWYPEPGHGGDIASRSEYAISRDEFEKRIPEEFWREVVDRVARELPDTLLLAEAFWMMEGYFVRTLGMHRVYNSAFMNMLKKEENQKYRDTVKNTIEFDPQVLKRFVNFMNNPDEETAVAQFGKGDKYFGVVTLMVTMPGLPMFGHGQIEGFSEKYGMEYMKAYWDETPDPELLERHEKEIFPLMKKRYLFAEIENFLFYDVWNDGYVNENVFAYSNCYNGEKSIVFYNNVYEQASGWIKTSCKYAIKTEGDKIIQVTRTLAEGLSLTNSYDTYCIFQEQRSGLWYIRRSSEIFEKGMFIHLNGFQSQVLLNICEVTDDGSGKYKKLHDTLSGCGVPDIEIAMAEIFLKELYVEFLKFDWKNFFADIHDLYLPNVQKKERGLKVKRLSEIFGEHKENGLAFYKMVEKFIEGNYGADEVLGKAKVENMHNADIIKKSLADNAWEKFERILVRLENLCDEAQKKTAKEMHIKLYEGFLGRPFAAEIFCGYALLISIKEVMGSNASFDKASRLVHIWSLDRKLREVLAQNEIPEAYTFDLTKSFMDVSRFADVALTNKDLKCQAYSAVRILIDEDNASTTMGVNLYDNVRWFNKEKTNDTFWCAEFLYAMCAEKFSANEIVLLEKIIFFVEEATEKSEYKADKLLDILKPSDDELEKYLDGLKSDENPSKTKNDVEHKKTTSKKDTQSEVTKSAEKKKKNTTKKSVKKE
ncbi:MAG: alpha-amylase [Treponema sp.]|nr:alpha-amylase [Treponema sp.]